MGEDVDFSHRVFLHYGEPLLTASSGMIVHHHVKGKRLVDDMKYCAARFYNTAIIRMNFRKYRPYRLVPFIWELRIGFVLEMIFRKVSPKDIFLGYIAYRKALRAVKEASN
jgi:hypothetical protein